MGEVGERNSWIERRMWERMELSRARSRLGVFFSITLYEIRACWRNAKHSHMIIGFVGMLKAVRIALL